MSKGKNEEQISLVKLELIDSSKTNPRKDFEKESLAELQKSISQFNVIQPIILRPNGKRFELVDGERRVRACKKLKKETIRAIVKEYSDDEVLEIQLIGFLHRKDLHPLEEAQSIKALLDTEKYTIQSIADKLGKQPSYIHQRSQLNKLNEDVKKVFLEGRIQLGHAILICKMQDPDQRKVLKFLEGNFFSTTVDRVREWIRDHLMLNLNEAPFSMKDKLLTPAGSCQDCQKRTGNSETLFPEIQGANICTDGDCYQDKVKSHIELSIHLAETQEKPLVKINSEYFSHTKKDVLGAQNYEVFDKKAHADLKDKAERAIVVTGKEKGKIKTIIRTELMPKPKAKEEVKITLKDEFEIHNKQVMAKREKSYYEQIIALIIQQDLTKELFPELIDELYFYADVDLEFYDMAQVGDATFADKIRTINTAYLWGNTCTQEQIIIIATRFQIDIKQIEAKVEEELPLLTKEDLKKDKAEEKQ